MSHKTKKAKRQAYKESQEKVLLLEAQVQALINGELKEFRCPFCNTVTEQGQMLCCNEAADVIEAILDHVEGQERLTIVGQIMDRFNDLQAKQSRITLN